MLMGLINKSVRISINREFKLGATYTYISLYVQEYLAPIILYFKSEQQSIALNLRTSYFLSISLMSAIRHPNNNYQGF